MQLFKCTQCASPIYFENTFCGTCGSSLGFLAEEMQLIAFNPGEKFIYCTNRDYDTCNWIIPKDQNSPFCVACSLNRTIPDLSNKDFLMRWKKLEIAKHRLIFSLLQMNLAIVSKSIEEDRGLAFDFVADQSMDPKEKILTGHDEGLITVNIAEADDIEREMTRKSMHEVYRTLLGHFRHEIGHYYWDRLIDRSHHIEKFRNLFGDERIDYAKSLENYYELGAPADWEKQYISVYSSSHPWEDWAETWAHYMHICDTLETASSFGVRVNPKMVEPEQELNTGNLASPYRQNNFDTVMKNWIPLTFAMNSLNRSMGLSDIYPFVISTPVIEKMKFIHEIVQHYN